MDWVWNRYILLDKVFNMFDINIAVQKQKDIVAHRDIELPERPKVYDDKVQHILEHTEYNTQAEIEGNAISRAYRSRTHIRLKRTYKIDGDTFPTGERHRLIGRNA